MGFPAPSRLVLLENPLLQALIDAGVSAVVQPGGSMRDDDVIAAADSADMSMVFTGTRHFRH